MTKLIPRSVIFGNPEKTGAQVSPDGTKLSYLAPVDGVLNIWVRDLPSGEPRAVTSYKKRPIRLYQWARDSKHLLYLQDEGGNENYHVFVVDLETSSVRDLTPFEGARAQIIRTSSRRPGEVLVGINKRDPRFDDVYLADLNTGDLKLVETNPGFGSLVGTWIVDQNLQPRAALRQLADGGVEIVAKNGEGWGQIYSVPSEDYLNFRVVGFNGEGDRIYLAASEDQDTAGLVELDLKTGETKTLASDDEYDLFDTGVKLHPTTRQVQLAAFFRDRLQLVPIDPSVQKDLERINAHDPGDPWIASASDDDQIWLIAYNHDNAPTTYCTYDRSTSEIVLQFEDRPELAEYELASTEPFTFKAGDGLTVHGYLTFPVGSERKGLPAVMVVHGGPWARDLWGFNGEIQWLANRGYLVIQVNYRGSTGYGKEFVNAADREWAAKMHTDLIDALEYVVAAGYADRKRIAIFGGSYGGYAALVGATFTPDVFTCAVDLVGPSNLITLLENIPPYWKPWETLWHMRVGHPEKDREFLLSRSPLSRVDQIQIPMLVAQGANDPRVTKVEAEQIVAAMKERDIPHTYLLFEDEGHGFSRPENMLKFAAEAERFLAEHLGGRYEE